MKKLQNPTTYFFRQAETIIDEETPEIRSFSNKLLNKQKCQLCLNKYDLLTRIPRIMIHCGHTFCTPCLKNFYMNRRVRCPMCLKLVKHLDKLQRLPINHTIYTQMVEKDQEICRKSGLKSLVADASKTLFAEFERAQKEAHLKEKPQAIDPESGLPFCVFHPDRVEHFFCTAHSSAGCRVCIEIGHSKSDCKVIDLYEIDDPNQLNSIMAGNSNAQKTVMVDDGLMPSFRGGELGQGRLNEKNFNNFIENIDVDGIQNVDLDDDSEDEEES